MQDDSISDSSPIPCVIDPNLIRDQIINLFHDNNDRRKKMTWLTPCLDQWITIGPVIGDPEIEQHILSSRLHSDRHRDRRVRKYVRSNYSPADSFPYQLSQEYFIPNAAEGKTGKHSVKWWIIPQSINQSINQSVKHSLFNQCTNDLLHLRNSTLENPFNQDEEERQSNGFRT